MYELPTDVSPSGLHNICHLLRDEPYLKSEITKELRETVNNIVETVEYGCLLGFLTDRGEEVIVTSRGEKLGHYDEICNDSQALFFSGIREYDDYHGILEVLYEEELRNIEVKGYIDESTVRRHLRTTFEYQATVVDWLAIKTFFKTLEAAGFGRYRIDSEGSSIQLDVAGARGKFKDILKNDLDDTADSTEEEKPGFNDEVNGISQNFDAEIVERCLPQFDQGHYQSAIRSGFVVLEDRIREEGNFSSETYGTDLVVEAFNPNTPGPLSFGASDSEKEGLMLLYKGAMQALRNPVSHRLFEDLTRRQAYDILCLINLLVSFVENDESDTHDYYSHKRDSTE